jgi:hypothetical protein
MLSGAVKSSNAAGSADFHVDLLGLLFMVWGALTMLIGASTLALGVAAAVLVSSSGRTGGGLFAAGLTAATFTTLALLALSWGLVHVVVGTLLRKRRHWSRLAALALSSVDLLLLPYGTALGGYSLWTLLRERAKPLFESATPGSPGRP